MNNKKISIKSAGLIAAAASVVTFSFTTLFSFSICNDSITELRNKSKEINRIYEVQNYINNNYYEDVDNDAITDAALKGMVSGLNDRYSAYMTPEEYEADIEDSKGSVSGIGITVTESENGTLKVIEVNPNSPAESAGIEINDIIIKINGNDISKMEYSDAVNLVRGEPETEVNLTIMRNETEKEFTMLREQIDTITVTHKMLENNIAYIRIKGFKENTVSQYKEALDNSIKSGAKAIIFDLRNNGGGLLTTCESCLDPLLPEGDVATALFKNGKNEVICRSDKNELNLPMAVLVNENTASASELFSSALRDFEKAVLVGKNTFGKGIMQNTVDLDGGGGLRITVAAYKTAKSDCYHGIGLKPDYEIDLPEKYLNVDFEEIPDGEDSQLMKALEVLK